MHTPRTIPALLIAAATALTLTACDTGDDPTPAPTSTAPTTSSPTPTPTETATEAPSEEPTQSYQDKQIEAAKQFVIDSYAASAELAANGYEGWQQFVNTYYSSQKLIDRYTAVYQQDAAEGGYLEGATEVVSITATEWEKDPTGSGHDAVTFDLCLDSRSVVAYNEDGSRAESQPMDHQYPATVTVIGQPGSPLGWTYIKEDVEQTKC